MPLTGTPGAGTVGSMRRLMPLLAVLLAVSSTLPWAGRTAAANPEATAGPAVAAPAAGSRILPPGRGCLYHGVYPGGITGEEDDIRPRDVAAYEAAAGHRVAWVYLSNNWYRREAFPARTATWIRDRGSVPFIRLMLRSRAGIRNERHYTLQRIIDGDFDAALRRWGRAARDFGTPLLVEYGTEMNGRWFGWNGLHQGGPGVGPRRFREAYRHIVRTIRGTGARNITWVWHVNATDDPAADWNRMERYWPGKRFVDWIGISAYGAQEPTEDAWPRFRPQLDRAVPRLQALAPRKPLVLLEFGVTDGNPRGSATAWADGALRDLAARRWPAIRGFAWWNETWQNDDVAAHDTDMRVQAIEGMPAVFQARLASPRVVDRPVIGQAGDPVPACEG
jgi:hypothetical protein